MPPLPRILGEHLSLSAPRDLTTKQRLLGKPVCGLLFLHQDEEKNAPVLELLLAAYALLESRGFEVVYIPAQNASAAPAIEMPWPALPSDASQEAVMRSFKPWNLPALILVDPVVGKMITWNGFGVLRDDAKGENFPWKKPGFGDMAPLTCLNELVMESKDDQFLFQERTICIMATGCAEEVKEHTKQVGAQVLEQLRQAGDCAQVAYCTHERGVAMLAHTLASVPYPPLPSLYSRWVGASEAEPFAQRPTLVAFDLPNEEFAVETPDVLSASGVLAFFEAFDTNQIKKRTLWSDELEDAMLTAINRSKARAAPAPQPPPSSNSVGMVWSLLDYAMCRSGSRG